MPSFATEVKNELARYIPEESCCRNAELAALLRMGATITFGLRHTFGLNFTTENAAVARKTLQLLKLEGHGLRTEITVSRSRRLKKHNSYAVRVMPEPAVADLLEHLGFLHDESLNMESDRDLLKKNCCRAAYLRGAFLGGGSVNRPEASYHLELVTGNYGFGNLLYTLMRRMMFPVGFTDRKEDYIVYLKEGDAVIDFLAMLRADKSVEAFEIARNLKEVREQVNRLVNCETANLQKTVDAAGRQVADIRRLAAREGGLEALPKKLRETAEARLARPDASIVELGELLGVSKSGMNHRLRKLHAMALAAEGEKHS
ncbi:DNA-binding protein WhiA [Mitsuokella sp. AF33-22]|uniref:DNA-binding protein WhiA n=1 Tax=Mitsuokella sp. AF33-22 TaxID=2292047 RepID=UPI000E479A99|nr:DNA-binding protein WhiA [Mitsuokella sp. AF33-22]RHM57058.1 DNA-binding protein WhiA [Mitsuokella sp. AF33-22]